MAKPKASDVVAVVEIRIEGEECPECGVIYGLIGGREAQRRNDGQTWYCPNGHPWVANGGKSREQVQFEEQELKRFHQRRTPQQDEAQALI